MHASRVFTLLFGCVNASGTREKTMRRHLVFFDGSLDVILSIFQSYPLRAFHRSSKQMISKDIVRLEIYYQFYNPSKVNTYFYAVQI